MILLKVRYTFRSLTGGKSCHLKCITECVKTCDTQPEPSEYHHYTANLYIHMFACMIVGTGGLAYPPLFANVVYNVPFSA